MTPNKALAVKIPWSQDQVNLITRTVAKGATPDELALFFNVAKRTGLDVFTKQIHFVKRKVWDKDSRQYNEIGTIQTGIDGYRAIAERSGQYAGNDEAIYDDESQAHPEKATVTVWRMVNGLRVGFTASARWDEYAPINPKTNEVMGQWKKMPYLMLGKCAEALALRKAFPNDLSGLYTEEEMDQANVDAVVVDAAPAKDEAKSAKKAEAAALMGNGPKVAPRPLEATATVEEEKQPEGLPAKLMRQGMEARKTVPADAKTLAAGGEDDDNPFMNDEE